MTITITGELLGREQWRKVIDMNCIIARFTTLLVTLALGHDHPFIGAIHKLVCARRHRFHLALESVLPFDQAQRLCTKTKGIMQNVLTDRPKKKETTAMSVARHVNGDE